MRIDEINARLAAIATEIDSATGDALTALEAEVATLTEERTALEAEVNRRQQLRSAVAAGEVGRVITAAPAAENTAERAAQDFMKAKRMNLSVDETRSAILTTGNLARPTEVSGINDIEGAKVSSIIDLIQVVNCEGMGTNRVAYVDSDPDADTQTEGSAATEAEPVFNYVDIVPTSVAVYSQISKQAQKQSPLNYRNKVQNLAFVALRKKAAAIAANALKTSTLNASVVAELDSSNKGKITEMTLRQLVLNHGGDEGISSGVLFLNKTDLLAFADLRGTNEKKAIYEVTPDSGNPNTGIIKDGGLAVKYCICSSLTACQGTARDASSGADKPTMIYGDPKALELDLFSQYEIKISGDFAFTSRMDTILGDVDLGADVVVKHGFTALTIKKAT